MNLYLKSNEAKTAGGVCHEKKKKVSRQEIRPKEELQE
jgi:tmRNA-binding protein